MRCLRQQLVACLTTASCLIVSVTATTQTASNGATVSASSGTAIPIAVYRGPGQYMNAIVPAQGPNSYESFLGRAVDFGLAFGDPITPEPGHPWDNLVWPNWIADTFETIKKTAIIGTSLALPGDYHRNNRGVIESWGKAAAGAYDAHWQNMGHRLVASGQAHAILRGAHEFNISDFAWRCAPGEQGDFVAAWRRWHGVMTAVPGNHFKFVWNPAIGHSAIDALSAYPGDAYLDYVGVDVYDGWYGRGWRPGIDAPPSRAEQDAVWDTVLNGYRGLKFWRDFATEHGKPLAFPEWGLQLWVRADGYSHGGGDNPAFVERMAAIINDPSWNVAFHAFWEDPAGGGRGVSDPDAGRKPPIPVPNARATFLRLFGGGTSSTSTTSLYSSTTTTAQGPMATTSTVANSTSTTSTTTPSVTTTGPARHGKTEKGWQAKRAAA